MRTRVTALPPATEPAGDGDTFALVPAGANLKPSASIAAAIRAASEATGVGFDYLLKTAACESSFRAEAKSRKSSAAGLFQFLEGTWLTTVRQLGSQLDVASAAVAGVAAPAGKAAAEIDADAEPDAGAQADTDSDIDAETRRALLDLRLDPKFSALVAGALARKNAHILAERLGREANDGELYIAHFLGPTGAARLIRLARSRPEARARTLFARAAAANRSIFYDGRRARTLAEVYAYLVLKHRQILTGPVEVATMPHPTPPLPNRRPENGARLVQLAAPQ